MGKNKVYSKIDTIPTGRASENLTEGCIVLEGGAFRGIYTSGVLDALMQEDINMSCILGVSAGALNGLDYAAGQIGRSGTMDLLFRHNGKYVDFRHIRKNGGVFGYDYMFGHLDEVEDLDMDRILSPKLRFVAEATNVQTGEAVFFETGKCSDIIMATRASSSMPYISRKVVVDGITCLDGGCAYKVPLDWPIEQGYKKIIIVRTRERGWRYTKKPSKMPKIFYRKYKGFANTLMGTEMRHNEICQRMEDMHDAGEIYVIWPSEHVTVKRLEGDMDKLGDLYWLGYNDTKAQISAIRAYLEKE